MENAPRPTFHLRGLLNLKPWVLAAVLVFALSLILNAGKLFPDLSEINAWDEASYIHSGRLLYQGQLPGIAASPLVAGLYALLYSIFGNDPFWLVHSATAGRLVLYGLLWVSAVLLARQLDGLIHPLAMVGLLFISAVPESLLSFPSDPLFVGMASLALWQLLKYGNSQSLRHLSYSSLFVGLAALSRNDGLLLIVLLAVGALLLTGQRRRWLPALTAAFGPFLGMVGGYLLLFGLVTGDFTVGTLGRTYDNFLAGHQVIYAGGGRLNPVIEAREEAMRVFGTPQANNYSVLRAIGRNPTMYLQRLRASLSQLPGQVLQAYGGRMLAVLLLFAGLGFWRLVRLGKWRLAAVLLIWPATLLSGLYITLFREGHLQFYYYILFALAAVGATWLVHEVRRRPAWILAGAGLISISGYGLLSGKLAIAYGGLAVLTSLALIQVWARGTGEHSYQGSLGLLLLFAVGLLLHGDYAGPSMPVLGDDGDEQALLYLTETYPEGTRVAAGAPGPIFAAKMTYMGLAASDVPSDRSSEEFLDWMKSQGIAAVYVDPSLYVENRRIWQLIESQIGEGLDREFVAEGGNIQVLAVSD